MQVIDGKGRLFGVVNVVDALVVLLVVAVAVAGATLVLGGDAEPEQPEPEPQPTRYATLSYTVPMDSQAATLTPNDTLTAANGGETHDVTDVYASFTPGGDVHVVARTTYEGTFRANGKRLYGGQSTPLTTGSYRVSANVIAVNQSGASIPTRTVPVVLRANVSASVAQAIEAGQRATVGDTTVATVQSVRTEAHRDDADRRTVWVGVDLTAWDRATGPTFDGQSLRVDNPVTVVTDTVVIRGRLHAVGTTDVDEATS